MLQTNHESNKRQSKAAAQPPKMHWRHMDILRWCDDTTEAKNVITVTPGKPPRIIWRTHDYCRSLAQVKPLIDAGYIEYLRTEIYAGGASCEIYITSKKGRAAVEAYYAQNHEDNAERYAAQQARIDAEQRDNARTALKTAIVEMYGYQRPAGELYEEIARNKIPFGNVPMPLYAPRANGQPVTIGEYLFLLWAQYLEPEQYKIITSYMRWSDTIGEEDAILMIQEHFGLIGDDGETIDE